MLDKYRELKYKAILLEMEQNMHAWEIIASGRVQNVGFRRYAYDCAHECRITGYVRNLRDGTVQIIASGDPERFLQFCAMLRSANRYILVQSLDICELNSTVIYNDFEIR